MLRLAVATNAETYERMQAPLADRGIETDAIETAERSIHVAAAAGGDSSQNGAGQFGEAFDVGFVFPPRLAEGGVADALLDVPWVNDRERRMHSRSLTHGTSSSASATPPSASRGGNTNPTSKESPN